MVEKIFFFIPTGLQPPRMYPVRFSSSRTATISIFLSPAALAAFFRSKTFDSELQAYQEAGLAYIAPELREGQFEIALAKECK